MSEVLPRYKIVSNFSIAGLEDEINRLSRLYNYRVKQFIPNEKVSEEHIALLEIDDDN